MRDIYTESVVPVKPSSRDIVLKHLLQFFLVLSFFMFVLEGLVGVIMMAAFGLLLYLNSYKIKGEYEYIHTNDIFDVDMVANNSRRKQLCSVDLSQVLLIARADSEVMTVFQHIQTTDYAGNAPAEVLYAMVYTQNGNQKKLLLQLNTEMYQSLKRWLPEKFR